MRLGTADVLVRAKTDAYHKKIDTAETRVKKFGKSAVSSIGAVTSSFASLAGITGVGAMTAAIITTGAKFESQMATVQGVMRATADQYNLLEAAALEMGEKTEWSATQSAEALNYMGMAGYTAEQAVAALPDVLNLATAGGMDLGRAADIVTDSLTVMGLGVQDLSGFNDVLVGTITRSNTNIEMMGESLKYAAPIAKQYGVDIESLSAMIGTLANAGIKASDAGTDLRQAMVRNKKAAKELGTAENDLVGTLKAAKKAGWGVNEVTEKYGLIASKSVLVLMDQVDAYDDLHQKLYDVRGETAQLAENKLDTLIGDFKILESTVEGVALSIAGDTNNSIRTAVQDLTATIRDNKGFIISLFSGIVTAGTKALDIVSQIARAAELLGVAAASSDKSFWDWFLLDSAGAKQWQHEIEDGTAFLKDQLHDVREEIDRFEYELDWGAGELSANQQAMLDNLKAQEKQILASIQNIQNAKNRIVSPTPGENHRNEPYSRIYGDGTGKTPAPSTGSGKADANAAEKKASAIASAYQSAYASMDTMTQATYDAMAAKYQQDYDEFVKLTGDKITAQAVFNQKMAGLNAKMLGVDDNTEAINRQIEALQTQADTFGMTASEVGVYRLENQGATDDQVAQAQALYDTIDALEKQQSLEAEGIELKAELRTETEQLTDEFSRLKKMVDTNAISLETYNLALSSMADESLGLDDIEIADNDFQGRIDAENEQYAEQLELLEQYRQERSDLNAEWDEKEAELTQQHQDKITAIEQERQQLALSSASSMFEGMADMIGTFAGESSGAYKVMFAVSKAFSVAEATINMFQAISEAGTLPFPGNIAAMAAVAAEMSTIVSSISAVGMAHDGIDSIPKTGTWLLEEGERVTTAETSDKLDRVLNNIQTGINSDSMGGSYSVNIPISVSGGNEQLAKNLGVEIEDTVLRMMRKEMR